MLHVEPRRRPTASQILNHAWIMRRENLPTNRIHLPEPNLIKVSVRNNRLCTRLCVFVDIWRVRNKILYPLFPSSMVSKSWCL